MCTTSFVANSKSLLCRNKFLYTDIIKIEHGYIQDINTTIMFLLNIFYFIRKLVQLRDFFFFKKKDT